MKNPGTCAIENTVTALEQAIESKKTQMMRNIDTQAGAYPVASRLFSEILNRAGGPYGQVGLALGKAQQSIKKDPWDVLRKVAAYSFGIGLFLSIRHKKPPVGKKE